MRNLTSKKRVHCDYVFDVCDCSMFRCILDILLEHIETVDKKTSPDTDEHKIALATRGRFLNLLAYLISQPAIKCTMLRIIR